MPLADRLLADLRSPRTYRRLLYLLIELPLGIFYFVFLVTALPLGAGLAVTFIGIPILIAALYATRWLAQMERWLVARLLGVEIAPPYRRPESDRLWTHVRTRLGDPATWKDLFFLLLQFPLGIAMFTAGVVLPSASLGLLTAPVWYWAPDGGIDLGWRVDTLPEALVLVPVGAVALLVSLRVINWLGALYGAFARTMLGATHDPELEARVTDLHDSRARIIAAADAERRRLERNLHDGAQQRLVALSMTLGMAEKRLARGEDAAELVGKAGEEARLAIAELRDLARGIHPAILTDRGLDAALPALVNRATFPVDVLATPGRRLAEPVEATAYFVVSEALANVGKYAEAARTTVSARVEGEELVVEVVDDGRGGADAATGSGLRGLADRVGALDGRLQITSPPGQGTWVRAALPLAEVPAVGDVRRPEREGEREPGPEPLERQPAAERRRRRGLETHALVFATLMGALVILWLVTGAGYFWPGWAIFGWGVVLALHAVGARS